MKLLIGTFLAAAMAAVAVTANAETIFEAKGLVTDKTPGFRFGNITFTDNDRVAAKFESVPMGDSAKGRLTTVKLKLPHKAEGQGAYFKFSFDCKYEFTPGTPGGKPQRCNQGVFFYDRNGKVLPDCYDTLYPGEGEEGSLELRARSLEGEWLKDEGQGEGVDQEMGKGTARHYERVLYAWDEVEEIEVFFQKPWKMNEKAGDRCSLEVSNVKIETATWEDAAAYADRVYAEVAERAPLDFHPEGDWTALLPRTMEALKTGKPWRVVMLGDSIVQDTFHSQFHALVKRAFPKSDVEWILSMRGGTGCWHYILAENFHRYVVAHKPDLLIIGGISNYVQHDDTNRKDIGPTGADAMTRVAKTAREWLGCEVLIVNPPLHCDRRPHLNDNPDAPLPKMPFSAAWLDTLMGGKFQYGTLKTLCERNAIQWWDETTPCYTWLFGSGLPFEWYSRDAVHSGEYGKQIIGRVMLAYLLSGERPAAPAPIVLENAALRAEVVPAWGGRLMSFGRPGGGNALWTEPSAATNTVDASGKPFWKNAGGEKTWVGGMSAWKGFKGEGAKSHWPPPAWFDSAPLGVVRSNATNVLLRSAPHTSGDWTVALEREFTLLGDRLVLNERLLPLSTNDNSHNSPQIENINHPREEEPTPDDPRRIWSVTQIPLVSRVRGRLCGEGRMALERNGKPCFPAPKRLDGTWIELDMDSAWKHAKLDFDGDAIAAPLSDGSGDWLVIKQTADARHLGAFATPSRAIVFTTGGDHPHPYIELEFIALGPDAAHTIEFRLSPEPPSD